MKQKFLELPHQRYLYCVTQVQGLNTLFQVHTIKYGSKFKVNSKHTRYVLPDVVYFGFIGRFILFCQELTNEYQYGRVVEIVFTNLRKITKFLLSRRDFSCSSGIIMFQEPLDGFVQCWKRQEVSAYSYGKDHATRTFFKWSEFEVSDE